MHVLVLTIELSYYVHGTNTIIFLLQFEKIKNDGYPLSRLSVAVKLLPETKKKRSCRMSCFTDAEALDISGYVLLARQYFEVIMKLPHFSMVV